MESTPITEELLKTLVEFGKEEDGSFCDRWQFTIAKRRLTGKYALYFFCEVDGQTWFIKDLKDFEDLQNVYKAITNEDLPLK